MDLLILVVVLALVATVGALIMGLYSMGRGGRYDLEHSERLMYARVGIQGIAVLFIMIALYLVST